MPLPRRSKEQSTASAATVLARATTTEESAETLPRSLRDDLFPLRLALLGMDEEGKAVGTTLVKLEVLESAIREHASADALAQGRVMAAAGSIPPPLLLELLSTAHQCRFELKELETEWNSAIRETKVEVQEAITWASTIMTCAKATGAKRAAVYMTRRSTDRVRRVGSGGRSGSGVGEEGDDDDWEDGDGGGDAWEPKGEARYKHPAIGGDESSTAPDKKEIRGHAKTASDAERAANAIIRMTPAESRDLIHAKTGGSMHPKDIVAAMAKRGRRTSHTSALPEEAVAILLEYVVANIRSPYPESDMKDDLARRTGLTPDKVRNWLTNIRKRHLTPILREGRQPRSQMELDLLLVAQAKGVVIGQWPDH